MTGLPLLVLTLRVLVVIQADVNISDYVYWKKEDINQYHQFFPSRALEEERRTIEAATSAVQSISSSISDDCSKIVAFQYRELQTAHELMAGTDAEGCINGISNFLDQAIQDQVDSYEDCTADAQSKIARLNITWTRTRDTYLTAYRRAQAGIDACAKNYPNKDSVDRLSSCVESMNKNYFLIANNTQSSVFPSPSMSYFQNTVVQCASIAANAVSAKGSKFLKMLVDCAALSGTVDPTSYEDELSQWKGYNGTLSYQIATSQTSNYYQVFGVELKMKNYYNLQKQALENYVIESRGLDFYFSKLFSYLGDYYNTVTATSVDNPGESECAATARSSLDNSVNASAALSLSCDEKIVNDTRIRMADVYWKFVSLNSQIPSIGNVAVLNCFSKKLIFAPETIRKCFNLTYTEFEIDSSDTLDIIAKETFILADYISSFYSNSQLPCGNTSLKRVVLAAEKVLYDLQRCLYKFSGTSYTVTTPIYTTTTPRMNINTTLPSYSTTTHWCPYNPTTEAYSYNRTNAGYVYNTTTEAYPYNKTTENYQYNTTTEAYPYNKTTASYLYNTTTEAYPYNKTTGSYQYNTKAGSYPYNKTTGSYQYNSTARPYSYSKTTASYQYNTTSYT